MKAIALVSGGLDSILAARLIQEQGIEVLPLNFQIPFCHRERKKYAQGREIASLVKENLRKGLKSVDISSDFLELLKGPRHGFGANMNPCIDCKILMLRKARELMAKSKAKFIVTGEVLGQRPMSQHKKALEIIAKRAGLEGLVLRPLSGKLLAQTIPEKEGWVKAGQLLAISGRGRRPQIELAGKFRIEKYAQPAGGCLLTEPGFARKVRDLLECGELNLKNVELLKTGRHFRLTPEAKLVVGRDAGENARLVDLAGKGDYLFMPEEKLAGPTALGRGKFSREKLELSCRITCRYCDLNGSLSAEIIYRRLPAKHNRLFQVSPATEKELESFRL